MSLDDFIITCFCLIDEMLPLITQGRRLRQRGPQPKLSESEVLTIEVMGSYLGLSQDEALFAYFREHYTHFFPALAHLHRSTFVRQAANLWAINEAVFVSRAKACPIGGPGKCRDGLGMLMGKLE